MAGPCDCARATREVALWAARLSVFLSIETFCNWLPGSIKSPSDWLRMLPSIETFYNMVA